MSISNQIIDKLDIVETISEYITIEKKGRNFFAICPFHQDSNPSMSISSEKKIYKCFSCGASGNLISFVQNFNKYTFPKTLEILAKKANIEFTLKDNNKNKNYSGIDQKMINCLNDANDYFINTLNSQEGKNGLKYLEKRNINKEILNKYEIGYSSTKCDIYKFLKLKGHDEATMINSSIINSNKNSFFKDRLIFPIKNSYGNCVGFSGRVVSGDDEPKYLNSPTSNLFNKSNILYNYSNAKDSISQKGIIYITEGFFDVISLDIAGYENAVCIMGTALTQQHIPLLKKLEVVLMYDGDKAGFQSTVKAIKLLIKNKIKTKVVVNETNKDPDEILNEVNGKDKIKELIENKIDWIYFIFNIIFKSKPSSHDEKISLIKKMRDYLNINFDNYDYKSQKEKVLANSILVDEFSNKLSEEMKIDKEIIINYLSDNTKLKNEDDNTQNIPIKKGVASSRQTFPHKNYYHMVLKTLIKNINEESYKKIFSQSKILFFREIYSYIFGKILNSDYTQGNNKYTDEAKTIIQHVLTNNDIDIATSEEEFADYCERLKKIIKEDHREYFIEEIFKKIDDKEYYLEKLKEITKEEK